MQRKAPDQEWEIEVDLQTKDGTPLRMMYGTNIEGENRGIVVDEITAHIGSKKVGYLKIELFPSSSLPLFFPSGVLNYMQHFAGNFVFPNDLESTDIKNTDIETLRYAAQFLSRNYFAPMPENGIETTSDFLSFYKTISKSKRFKSAQDAYKSFLDFRLDRAFVAYVNTIGAKHVEGFEDDNSRRGIGTALYIAGSLEMERQGMRLRASGVQSEQARSIWSSFEKRNLVEMDGDRRYISAPLIRENLGITLLSAPNFSI